MHASFSSFVISFAPLASIHDRHMYTLADKPEQYVSVLMMLAITRSDCVAVLLLFTRPELTS